VWPVQALQKKKRCAGGARETERTHEAKVVESLEQRPGSLASFSRRQPPKVEDVLARGRKTTRRLGEGDRENPRGQGRRES
jgi:hypothetical protein